MNRYVFIGGPFDGAYADTDRWPAPPDELWIYGDAAKRGRFGLMASIGWGPGRERYILSARLGDRNEYLHESVHSSRGHSRRAEAVR